MRDCLEGLEKRLRAMSEEPSSRKGSRSDDKKKNAADRAMDDEAQALENKDQEAGEKSSK
jgi:hypothetical protein